MGQRWLCLNELIPTGAQGFEEEKSRRGPAGAKWKKDMGKENGCGGEEMTPEQKDETVKRQSSHLLRGLVLSVLSSYLTAAEW